MCEVYFNILNLDATCNDSGEPSDFAFMIAGEHVSRCDICQHGNGNLDFEDMLAFIVE